MKLFAAEFVLSDFLFNRAVKELDGTQNEQDGKGKGASQCGGNDGLAYIADKEGSNQKGIRNKGNNDSRKRGYFHMIRSVGKAGSKGIYGQCNNQYKQSGDGEKQGGSPALSICFILCGYAIIDFNL